MTVEECAIVEAYTGIVMLAGDRRKYSYEYVSKLIGRPVFTHEFFTLADTIKELSKEDFFSLCQNAVPEKDRHARWNDYGPYYKCTGCGTIFKDEIAFVSDSEELPKYCPECGRRMDEE